MLVYEQVVYKHVLSVQLSLNLVSYERRFNNRFFLRFVKIRGPKSYCKISNTAIVVTVTVKELLEVLS